MNGLDRLEGDALGPLGVESASAARTSTTPTSNQGLVVALTAFAAKPGGTFKGQVDQQASQGTNPAVLSFCASATSSSPTTNTAIAGIPGSHLATCTTAAGMSLVVAAWAKANVLALVYGSDPRGSTLSTPQSISDLALRQTRLCLPPIHPSRQQLVLVQSPSGELTVSVRSAIAILLS